MQAAGAGEHRQPAGSFQAVDGVATHQCGVPVAPASSTRLTPLSGPRGKLILWRASGYIRLGDGEVALAALAAQLSGADDAHLPRRLTPPVVPVAVGVCGDAGRGRANVEQGERHPPSCVGIAHLDIEALGNRAALSPARRWRPPTGKPEREKRPEAAAAGLRGRTLRPPAGFSTVRAAIYSHRRPRSTRGQPSVPADAHDAEPTEGSAPRAEPGDMTTHHPRTPPEGSPATPLNPPPRAPAPDSPPPRPPS